MNIKRDELFEDGKHLIILEKLFLTYKSGICEL